MLFYGGMNTFAEELKKLNKAQNEAVEAIDGPVMVVAGPGTGKTQILALRIANILEKTDTHADGILCLTFTNSGVFAMRERLRKYIGGEASKIEISTFHSFASKIIDDHFTTLGFLEKPKMIDDVESVAICDIILSDNDFKHLKTRANKATHFHDIKSLVSLLKRERLSPEKFEIEIKNEIKNIKDDPGNISSRGASKGSLKQDAVKKIEGLERTLEVVKFYELYEEIKKEKCLLDFDDVLEELVRLVEISEDARDTIREKYLYVLVDEHQDSSGVQNKFLACVWGDVESPNIFVVGDDRQLIYGFGGASLSYFEGFQKAFHGTKLITLTENYRSTKSILDIADSLLQSSMSEAKLSSNQKEDFPLRIVSAEYLRDEIIRAGLEIKSHLEKGAKPDEFAVLVPKNREVKSAIRILNDLGLPVSRAGSGFFLEAESLQFLEILRVLASPESPEYVANILLSPISGISPIVAHKFLAKQNNYELTLSKLLEQEKGLGLYKDEEEILIFAEKLKELLSQNSLDVYSLIQKAGDVFLVKTAKDHDTLSLRVEIIRTLLTLAEAKISKKPNLGLNEFLAFLDRLQEYNTEIPLAIFSKESGVRVMTLHASKGLEFEYVYICHLDEKNLLGRRSSNFTLPESIKELEHKKDIEAVKRELYVAITRAKKYCTLSYSNLADNGAPLEFSHILSNLPENFFEHINANETEEYIKSFGIESYIKKSESENTPIFLNELAEMVKGEYVKNKIAVTHLNNFFSCPWTWYFRNFIKLPEPKSVSLVFGSLVHSVLEAILKNKILPKDYKKLLQKLVGEIHGFSEKVAKEMERDAVVVIDRYIKERLPSVSKEHESEKPLSHRDPKFPHLLFTGKIDLVEVLDPKHRKVTDFKTGKAKKKSEIEKDSEDGRMSDFYRQLAMYTYLLTRSTNGNVSVLNSELLFLEDAGKDAVYNTQINEDHVTRLLQDIKDFDEALSSGNWVNRECNFKPWKAGEVCEYCKLAEIYKKK